MENGGLSAENPGHRPTRPINAGFSAGAAHCTCGRGRRHGVADMGKARRKAPKAPSGPIARLGGMTGCLQPIERRQRATFETVKAPNGQGAGHLAAAEPAMVADDGRMRAMGKGLARIQITVTAPDGKLAASCGKAGRPSAAGRQRGRCGGRGHRGARLQGSHRRRRRERGSSTGTRA